MMDDDGGIKHASIESIDASKEIQSNPSGGIHNHRILKKTLIP